MVLSEYSSLMNFRSLVIALLLACFSQLFISCETTHYSYGYVATALDDENILSLFELMDESVNEEDFDDFKSLHSPKFRKFDDSEDSFSQMDPVTDYSDYMVMAREFFREANKISIYTQVTDVQIAEDGLTAKVTVQEDLSRNVQGFEKRTVTLAEVTVAFEDGWIYFEEWRDLARQEIKR